MTNIADQTLASIVTDHYQTVPVLEKYNLDFCCKGKRTLAEACTEKGLSIEAILAELEASSQNEIAPAQPFSEMSAEKIISYIIFRHHFYVKQSMPTTVSHLEKVALKHGNHYPYMIEVLQLFTHLKNEMMLHMNKEEMILFPRIKEVAALQESHQKRSVAEGYLKGPTTVMEHEHDEAGAIMERIRILTNNYTPPVGACTTFTVALNELKEFEEDLHKHVHLENNILFPMAERLMKEVG